VVYRVIFHPEAESELGRMYDDLAVWADPVTALNFVRGIRDYCMGFATFPKRGTERIEIMPGLRVVGYRRSVTIAFVVSNEIVMILGIFHNGREITSDMLEQRRE
jgi:toxin ParE1/3/4